jgi:hypothetical protein
MAYWVKIMVAAGSKCRRSLYRPTDSAGCPGTTSSRAHEEHTSRDWARGGIETVFREKFTGAALQPVSLSLAKPTERTYQGSSSPV